MKIELTKEEEKKVISLLKEVFNCCDSEIRGSSEHIAEYVSRSEIKEVAKILGFEELSKLMTEYVETLDNYEDKRSKENESAVDVIYEKFSKFGK